MAAPNVETARGTAAPGALGAWGEPVSEEVAVGVVVETRLTEPLGLVPLMEVSGMAESVLELAELELVMVEVVALAAASLVATLDEAAVLEAAADELDEVGSSTNLATIRISVHCAPIDSS
jgi:hypothetical protein